MHGRIKGESFGESKPTTNIRFMMAINSIPVRGHVWAVISNPSCFSFALLGIKPTALSILGKCSTTDPHSKSCLKFFKSKADYK
jgi:hypothetical protein